MTRLYPEILSADLIAFVTPVYYFGISTQLKTAIDRFFSINKKIRKFPKKAVLLAAFGEHFEPFLGYRKRKKPCKYTLQGFAIICFDILRYGRDSNPRPPA